MFAIGKFLSTHGLKGGIKLQSFCEIPEDIFDMNLYLKNENKIICKKIGNTSKSDIFLAQINGVNSIEQAEQYKNTEVFVKREELEEPEEDEYYINDLIGAKVICDNKTGIVKDIYNFGAGDSIEIQWDDTKKIESFPFIEQYIKEVDIKNKTINIEKPKYI